MIDLCPTMRIIRSNVNGLHTRSEKQWFNIYVCQIIMLYTLNLHNVVYQLYFNNAGGIKRKAAIVSLEKSKINLYTVYKKSTLNRDIVR